MNIPDKSQTGFVAWRERGLTAGNRPDDSSPAWIYQTSFTPEVSSEHGLLPTHYALMETLIVPIVPDLEPEFSWRGGLAIEVYTTPVAFSRHDMEELIQERVVQVVEMDKIEPLIWSGVSAQQQLVGMLLIPDTETTAYFKLIEDMLGRSVEYNFYTRAVNPRTSDPMSWLHAGKLHRHPSLGLILDESGELVGWLIEQIAADLLPRPDNPRTRTYTGASSARAGQVYGVDIDATSTTDAPKFYIPNERVRRYTAEWPSAARGPPDRPSSWALRLEREERSQELSRTFPLDAWIEAKRLLEQSGF